MKNAMSNAAIDAAQSARDILLESSCSSRPGPSATGNQVELRWLNKVLRLLETKDGDGWVVGDVRPTGVRLLAPPFTIGNVPPNLLIRSDALCALRGLGRLGQYKHHFGGNIKLCYLDRPFNAGSLRGTATC